MRLLLDTHVLLWLLDDLERVSLAAREVMSEPTSELIVSAASLMEIAIKRNSGKLAAREDFPERLPELDVTTLPIMPSHAWRAGGLPLFHRDPFDRLLVAQALEEGLTLVTRDAVLSRYGVAILAA